VGAFVVGLVLVFARSVFLMPVGGSPSAQALGKDDATTRLDLHGSASYLERGVQLIERGE
jgi:hypothetical protein